MIRYLTRIDNSLGKKFSIRLVTGLVDAEEADLKILGRAISGNLATKQEQKLWKVKKHDPNSKYVSMADTESDRDGAISMVEKKELKLGLKLKNQCVDRHVYQKPTLQAERDREEGDD